LAYIVYLSSTACSRHVAVRLQMLSGNSVHQAHHARFSTRSMKPDIRQSMLAAVGGVD